MGFEQAQERPPRWRVFVGLLTSEERIQQKHEQKKREVLAILQAFTDAFDIHRKPAWYEVAYKPVMRGPSVDSSTTKIRPILNTKPYGKADISGYNQSFTLKLNWDATGQHIEDLEIMGIRENERSTWHPLQQQHYENLETRNRALDNINIILSQQLSGRLSGESAAHEVPVLDKKLP